MLFHCYPSYQNLFLNILSRDAYLSDNVFAGNPFGPAGTGKTESVKMLGSQLGRFVLVFNCDASFDYAAMGRIFAGLCQVGAWVSFLSSKLSANPVCLFIYMSI